MYAILQPYIIIILTAPKAKESSVCILGGSAKSGTLPNAPFLCISSLPVIVQNLICLTPTVTKLLSESGRNSAWNILWLCPGELAALAPEYK